MNTYQRYLVDEFVGDFREGLISRRVAFKRIALITGSAAVAASLLKGVTPARAQSAPEPQVPPGVRVPEDDPSVRAQWITFSGPASEVTGYLAMPAAGGVVPGVIVVHENRGLVPHIQDVTRRAAKAGFVGLAVDLLSRVGGTDNVPDPDQIPALLIGTPATDLVADLMAGVGYLTTFSGAKAGGYGVVGFCMGGGLVWRLATSDNRIKAAAPFYGPNPPLEDIPNLAGPVVAVYGTEDQFIDPGIPALTEALVKAGKPFEMVMYAGANHAFHNDTGPRYVPAAAMDAWARTVALFRATL